MATRSTRGLRARFRRIRGLTPKSVLRHPLYLQVVINDFEVPREAGHTDYQTVSAGEFSQPWAGKRAPTLREVDFESLTLTWDADWATGQDTAARIRRELDKIVQSRQPAHLLIHRSPHGHGAEFAGPVTIRSLSRRHTPGEADTVYYDLSVKDYREANLRRRGHPGGGGKEELPVKHKLSKDDTLRSLSKRYYGRETYWRFIADKNGIKKWGGATPLVKMGRYKAGDRVTIPELALITASHLSGGPTRLGVADGTG